MSAGKRKLAVITSHPVQYNAPMFEELSRRGNILVKVFYTWGETVLKNKFDPGFGKVIEWDIPLLHGYSYEFVDNVATNKGSHHFKGIDNPSLPSIINEYQPDAVLIYGWSFKSHLSLMRKCKGKIPVIFRGDSTLLDDTGFIQRIKRTIFLRWVYRYIDVALYAGKSNYAYFRKAGVPASRLVFGPHAIDNDRFHCSEAACKEQAGSLRAKLGISSNELLFVFAGKLEPKKDPEILLRAFANARFESRSYVLIVGNGILEKELKEAYASHKDIFFMDFMNQTMMPALYAAADVFVLPSKGPGETWGLSVNEAMANARPVIVSNKCGCASDLVEDGVNGFVFNASDESALTTLLERMSSSKISLAMMGARSREKIAGYSYSQVAKALEAVVTSFPNKTYQHI